MESYFKNPGALESVSSSIKLLQNDITGETAFSVSIHPFQLRIGIRGSDPLPVVATEHHRFMQLLTAKRMGLRIDRKQFGDLKANELPLYGMGCRSIC